MRIKSSARSALALLLVAGVAHAQTPEQVRIRGTIQTLGSGRMDVATRTGETQTVVIGPAPTVTALTAGALSSLKPGDYIGTAALPQPDGTLRALEIQVFPESMRGVGEGTRPWDVSPGSIMTNGTVGGSVVGTEGRTITVRYANGEKTVAVPPDAPVVIYGPGSPDLLTAGAHVFLTATRAEDGTLSASRVTVGKDGLVPPM